MSLLKLVCSCVSPCNRNYRQLSSAHIETDRLGYGRIMTLQLQCAMDTSDCTSLRSSAQQVVHKPSQAIAAPHIAARLAVFGGSCSSRDGAYLPVSLGPVFSWISAPNSLQATVWIRVGPVVDGLPLPDKKQITSRCIFLTQWAKATAEVPW